MAVFSYLEKLISWRKLILMGRPLIASNFDVNYYRKQGNYLFSKQMN